MPLGKIGLKVGKRILKSVSSKAKKLVGKAPKDLPKVDSFADAVGGAVPPGTNWFNEMITTLGKLYLYGSVLQVGLDLSGTDNDATELELSQRSVEAQRQSDTQVFEYEKEREGFRKEREDAATNLALDLSMQQSLGDRGDADQRHAERQGMVMQQSESMVPLMMAMSERQAAGKSISPLMALGIHM